MSNFTRIEQIKLPKSARIVVNESGDTVFNKDTVSSIAQNAKAARDIWNDFAHDKKLCECFHLRPTASGISVISILHYAPMRGISVQRSELKNVLTDIAGETGVLLGVKVDESLKLMKKWGFKNRESKNKNSENFIEENAQAFFIHGMILKQSMYEGINFVASELVLADKSSRFDIVGYKAGTLYIFEMKKDRTLAGLTQTAGYATLINDNKSLFLEVLRNYPHYPVDDFEKVVAVAVMQYAANSVTLLEKKAKEAGVGLWFYERSIALRKASI